MVCHVDIQLFQRGTFLNVRSGAMWAGGDVSPLDVPGLVSKEPALHVLAA